MRSPKYLDIRVAGTEITFRVKWWHPSFWRYVRDSVEVTPAFLTWPVVLWCIFRHFALRSG
jgi:hypothetical protein